MMTTLLRNQADYCRWIHHHDLHHIHKRRIRTNASRVKCSSVDYHRISMKVQPPTTRILKKMNFVERTILVNSIIKKIYAIYRRNHNIVPTFRSTCRRLATQSWIKIVFPSKGVRFSSVPGNYRLKSGISAFDPFKCLTYFKLNFVLWTSAIFIGWKQCAVIDWGLHLGRR